MLAARVINSGAEQKKRPWTVQGLMLGDVKREASYLVCLACLG
jgi:hypothetical protein